MCVFVCVGVLFLKFLLLVCILHSGVRTSESNKKGIKRRLYDEIKTKGRKPIGSKIKRVVGVCCVCVCVCVCLCVCVCVQQARFFLLLKHVYCQLVLLGNVCKGFFRNFYSTCRVRKDCIKGKLVME